MHRLFRALVNSCRGFRAAARTDQAFRQELVVLVAAVPAAFFLAAEPWKRLLLIGVIVVLLAIELLNTAIEKLADRVSRESDIDIGTVKDIGSAAVGLGILLAGLTWLVALAEWLEFL
jgi:diacylglycerol kinase (ATP)